MRIPDTDTVRMVADSLVNHFRDDNPYPAVRAYLEMKGEDVPFETVARLREEFEGLRGSLGEVSWGVFEERMFVPVESVAGRMYSSNSDAGFFLTAVGVEHNYHPAEAVQKFFSLAIDMCDEAIRRGCGFGRYSMPSRTG